MYFGQALTRHEPFWDVLQTLTPFTGAEVLDIGCGDGARSFEILKRGCRHLEAVDTNEQLLRLAQADLLRKPRLLPELDVDVRRVTFRMRDGHDLRCKAETFDRVVLCLSLHHMRDMSRAIREAVAACKRDGRIIIIEPQAARPHTLYEAEMRFGIIDGDEEQQKELARRAIDNHHDLEVVQSFVSDTIYRCNSYDRFCQATKPRKSVDQLREFLEPFRKGGHFEIVAPRQIHICRPNY